MKKNVAKKQTNKKAIVESNTVKSNYFFVAAYALSIIMLIILFRPFLTALILGSIIAIFFYPLNIRLRKKLSHSLSAAIMTISIFLIIIIPSFFLASALVNESISTYNDLKKEDLQDISNNLNERFNLDIDAEESILSATNYVTSLFTTSINTIISSIADLIIKTFLILFFLFFAFRDGDKMVYKLFEILPISKNHKEQLIEESNKVLFGVMYGQFLMAILQGFLGWFAFFIFGFNNPIFWGFIVGILAFIPMLGTTLVWLPAGIIAISQGNMFGGIGMLVYGALVMFTVENIIKPKYIGRRIGMHPLLIILGIFGGLKMFGLIGFILGPMIVAIAILIIKFFNKDVIFR